ncbi:hypothetical protein [Rubrivivax gelatinosus]|uniref:Toxin-antitoxin system HicB family antitoxin n=1 Tax=Rubrivivax gelatinosus (strain NBRC 100245 / IL144) TaxID=983917 RepID=I0HRE2_RUBGI|nr:hypothetical protein [Rubrivivax gelatinosus]MBG6082111.1 hypothetical protein [Rubrivivax gelatinosus]BAL95579.1 hypothetical protein RGE_22380 [Rubrivivax gelatinosus IL144]
MASPGKKAFALRIDPLLWAEVERLAAADLRSVNAEVEVLLREALRTRLGEAAMARLARRPRPPSGDGDAES